MDGTIPITASLRIEAAPDVVRAQYRDMDHHIRNNVHKGITLTWQPSEPGQRKIKTEFRIMGIAQYDVAFLEDEPDGTLLIRNVEGTNAGMVVRHEFVPLDGGKATEVRLRADAPATLARRVLGPLFVCGARQVLKKALHEDKADLEKGTYKPGAAAGNLDRALSPLAKGTSPEAARAVVAAAWLVATSDGILEREERETVGAIAAKLGVDAAWVDEQGVEIAKLTGDAVTARARAVGADLGKGSFAEQGVEAAAAAGLVSQGMSLGELSMLRAIAAAAGVTDEQLERIVEKADAALSA
jgi:hypothetical protein